MGDDYDTHDGVNWDYYSYGKPRKVAGGIKTRNERGAIGSTWWSRRWLASLEALGMGTRLTRGRSYARQGQVLSIDVQSGSVHARVQGSLRTPYKIEIRLTPFTEAQWSRVTTELASQAIFAARLLAGEMPQDIESIFQVVNLPLFPTAQQDLRTSCSCPDWANPCKHIAAVYYIMAEQFDDDPFVLFTLRGHTKEQVLQDLRARRIEKAEPAHQDEAQSLEGAVSLAETAPLDLDTYLDAFWRMGDDLISVSASSQTANAEHVGSTLLRRSGDAPLSVKKQNLVTFLLQMYDSVQSVVERESNQPDL
ncbi:SWIM zinc finger family protein [Dictyobacter arantiisoli]|uniref:SWIM-type domain-containing protein n=1 Tax=Dictyobacter arantiisoli TaxID=2014874 RepID=A0A5A5TET8_9CHLR|nr:SWIM zinc finger family protein [Dictyobacter arantiisoli]GCF09593.1 hypothetical protein KDI_31570 [Dictyobacter arantiisoli]